MLANSTSYKHVTSILSNNATTIQNANILGGTAAITTNLYKKFQEVTIVVSKKSFTITYHGNGATAFTEAGTASGNTSTKDGELIYTQNVTTATSDEVKLDSNPFSKTDNDAIYGMKYWNTQANETVKTNYKDRDEINLTDPLILSVADGGNIDLYAQWTTGDIGDYWMAASIRLVGEDATPQTAPQESNYYTNPETSVVKTQDEITEDLEVLHGTKDQTSDGRGATEVAKEYQGYSDSDYYHLYTTWAGSTENMYDTSVDKYVEFRIVNVGEHDCDGSALTFMAVHGMPLGENDLSMNSINTNNGGWLSSDLNANTMPVIKTGLSKLDGVAKTITKKTVTGYATKTGSSYDSSTWDTSATFSSKFWLMSFSEVYGYGNKSSGVAADLCANEGTQYNWFKNKVDSSKENCFKDTYMLRSNVEEYGYHGIWFRSVNMKSNTAFIACYSGSYGGNVWTYYLSASYKYNTLPMFAM